MEYEWSGFVDGMLQRVREGVQAVSIRQYKESLLLLAMIEFLAVYSNSQRLGIREDERRFHKSADSRVVR